MAYSRHSTSKARIITVCGVLTALSVVLQFLEIPIPIMPSFIKFDFSDLPALLGAFAYGPIAGICISLLKNLIHLIVSQSGFVGELSNFILCSTFSGAAGLLYLFLHTKRGAFLSGTLGALLTAAVCYPLNLFVIYPLYYSIMGFPKPAVLGLYQIILPSVRSIPTAILIFNVPFTFLKGMISVGIAMLLYKRLTGLLFNKKEKSE